MGRIELLELHDHPKFPAGLRDLVTDALEALWEFGNSYKPILDCLYEGLSASGERPVRIVDLCSGGGGPWLRLSRELVEEYHCPIELELTDKYPNLETVQRLDRSSQTAADSKGVGGCCAGRIRFRREPVDALEVPEALRGFRTMFSAFHHFDPQDARRVLANAVASNEGIAIFEVARRGAWTMLVLCFTPFLVLLLTPGIRPFRWSRLFWTYLIPVVPFVIWFDGLVSCLRTYSTSELEEMVQDVSKQQPDNNYRWQTGEQRTGLLPVTYLVGYPVAGNKPASQGANRS